MDTIGGFSAAPLGRAQRAGAASMRWRLRLKLLLALACWSAVEALFVVRNFSAVSGYYLGGHVLNAEKGVRAIENGVGDLVSAGVFYARAFLFDQLGIPGFVLLALLGLVVTGVLVSGSFFQLRTRSGAYPGLQLPGGVRWSAVVLGAATVVPYGMLTVDQVKSPVVGDVLLPPGLLLAILAVAGAAQRATWLSPPMLRRTLLACGAVSLVLGGAAQLRDLRRHVLEHSSQSDVAHASRFIMELAELRPDASGGTVWAMDAHVDFAPAQVVRIYYFERRGQWLPLVGGLGEGAVFSTLAPEQARAQAAEAGVLILTHRVTAPPPVYPYDQSIEDAEPLLVKLAAERFDLRARGSFFGRDVFGFVRRDDTAHGNSQDRTLR